MTTENPPTIPKSAKSSTYRWTFFRAGGFDQVKLESGEDLLHIGELDQKLWVALACPTTGLEIDARTLGLIDNDRDGRVRPNELIAAVLFAGRNLKNPDDLLKGETSLPLASIQDATAEGKALLASARQILGNIGKKDATSLSIEDVSDKTRIFADTPFNGDGVITELSADGEVRALIADIIACEGGVADLSGKPGVDAAQIAAFFADARAHSAWWAKAEADKGIWPLGDEKTAAAVSAILAIRAKVDDFFARVRVAAFDSRALPALNRQQDDYLAIAAKDMSLTAAELAAFPLAQIVAGKPEQALPLSASDAINPAHADALAALARDAVTPLLGERNALTENEWRALLDKIAPYLAWQAAKEGVKVEKLGRERIAQILAAPSETAGEAKLLALVAQDKSLEAETASIEKVECLVRYYKDLALLCTNFVNFKDFYDGNEPAIFQCGTLFLDQRECRLCMRVEDAAKHATMAGLAGAYLAYVECTRKSSGEKMLVVAAFTAGDGDNLMVGRNGIFYDRKGRDFDATITKIVDNPISIRQAFWSPYKKFVRYLEEQVTKRAAAAEAEAQTKLETTAVTAVNVDKTKPPATPKKLDVGTVAALGVAFGAIGTFFTALVGYAAGVFKLGLLPTLFAVAGVILLISMPSVIMAYIKLRKRNLGPILDANGWAVNAKAKINVPFGATLSSVAKLPAGSRRTSGDRYAEKAFPWKSLALLFLLLYGAYRYYTGSLDKVLPRAAKSTTVLGKWSPKADSGVTVPTATITGTVTPVAPGTPAATSAPVSEGAPAPTP
jgi:hypothetical protein